MKSNSTNAIDFTYLLIDYYKELEITNDELVVLLMIEHLINDGDKLITNSNLEVKLNMSSSEIDRVLDSLFNKKIISYQTVGKDFVTTLDPLKEVLFKKYRDSVLNNLSEEDTKKEETQKKVYQVFQHYFERDFSNVEYNLIDSWIDSGADEQMITNALIDALSFNRLNFSYINAIIKNKLLEKNGGE